MAYKEFKELQEKQKELLKQMEGLGKDAMIEVFQEVFKKYPKLDSFAWTQYTDYFNDGEPVYFSVHADELELNGVRAYNVRFDENGKLKEKLTGFPFREKEYDEIQEELSGIIYSFDEDILKLVLGDHIKVIVTREGIETDGYDHD